MEVVTTRNRRSLLFAAAPALFLLILSLGSRLMQSAAETPDESPLPAQRLRTPSYAAPKIAPVSPETQAALEGLVSSQLDAIRKHDYAAAIEFAHPAMRHQWTPASFGRMIDASFAKMPDSVAQRCQRARAAREGATMLVRIAGNDERDMGACVYTFGQSEERWYITGCSPVISYGDPGRNYNATMMPFRISNGDMDSVRQ